MKKILSLALVAVMLLMSALCVSAADTCEVTVTVAGDNGKAGDVITVTATIDGFETLYSAQVDVMYDNTKVVLWDDATGAQAKVKADGTYTVANAKKALADTIGDDLFDDVAYDGDYEETAIWGQYKVSCNGKFFSFSVSAAGSDADQMPAIIEDGYKMFDLTFVRLADGTAGDTGIAIATNNPGNPDGILANASSTALGVVTKTLNYVIDTPAPSNPFSATIAGSTITCAGKVDATVANYGVEFTAESTVEGARAQKYYGAMPGDTVKDYNGSTTFTFGDWDGSFEIILEGVHAGTKVLNFFANDTIIADTTFTVVAE